MSLICITVCLSVSSFPSWPTKPLFIPYHVSTMHAIHPPMSFHQSLPQTRPSPTSPSSIKHFCLRIQAIIFSKFSCVTIPCSQPLDLFSHPPKDLRVCPHLHYLILHQHTRRALPCELTFQESPYCNYRETKRLVRKKTAYMPLSHEKTSFFESKSCSKPFKGSDAFLSAVLFFDLFSKQSSTHMYAHTFSFQSFPQS